MFMVNFSVDDFTIINSVTEDKYIEGKYELKNNGTLTMEFSTELAACEIDASHKKSVNKCKIKDIKDGSFSVVFGEEKYTVEKYVYESDSIVTEGNISLVKPKTNQEITLEYGLKAIKEGVLEKLQEEKEYWIFWSEMKECLMEIERNENI